MSPTRRTGGTAVVLRRGQRVNAGEQLNEVEGLGQVVVGTEGQPGHPFLHAGTCRQHEDARAAPGPGQRRADLVTAAARQVTVEDRDVVAQLSTLFLTRVAVGRDIDREPVLA
jgi:hypothetical protein